MAIEILSRGSTAASSSERWGVKNDAGEVMTSAYLTTAKTRFASDWINSLLIGGVGTAPEHRRGGHVREILNEAFRQAASRGWAVSLLHPFSFSYYRKFGYERVADHLIVDFPLSKLEFVPRCPDLVKLKHADQLPDVLSVYEAFSRGRNVMGFRADAARYPMGKSEWESATYIHYDGAKPDGCITLSINKELDVNHYRDGVLTVREMAYTTREGLGALLGFMRMFDGELDTVHLENIAMSPEVDWVLRHYTHTSYRVLPDIMARILDTETLLRANAYPLQPGEFTLKATDDMGLACGTWRVRYGGGTADVQRMEDDAPWDVCADAAPLAQLLYGAVSADARTLPYLASVRPNGRAEDFLRAFPKRPCGMFEHF